MLHLNGATCALTAGQYSDWIPVTFRASLGTKIRGICRFLLIAAEPDFKLYVTPINIDPDKPVMPISHPQVYATYLAKRQGRYATLGLAEDSWALNEQRISDEQFIEQCLQTDRERVSMFFDAVDNIGGDCACVCLTVLTAYSTLSGASSTPNIPRTGAAISRQQNRKLKRFTGMLTEYSGRR